MPERWRRPTVVLCAAALLAGSGTLPAQAATGQHVVAMSRLSSVPPGAPSCRGGADAARVAVDPSNSAHLVAEYSVGDARAVVAAVSRDGGRSWTQQALPGLTGCAGGEPGSVYDMYVAASRAGSAAISSGWVSGSSAPALNGQAARLLVSSAGVGGRFGPPVTPERRVGAQRGPMVYDPGDPHRLFVLFETFDYLNPQPGYLDAGPSTIELGRSDDGGGSFASPVTVQPWLVDSSLVTVGVQWSGSDLVAVYGAINLAQAAPTLLAGGLLRMRMYARRSADEGRSFGPPSFVGECDQPTARLGATPAVASSGCSIPDMASGPRGRLYVSWVDATSGQVLVARSTDGGKRWRRSTVAEPAHGALLAAVAAEADGTVGVLFDALSPDQRHPGHLDLVPQLGVSKDQRNWQVTTLSQPFDANAVGDGSTDGSVVGPMQGLVALPRGFGASVTLGTPYASPGDEQAYWIRTAP